MKWLPRPGSGRVPARPVSRPRSGSVWAPKLSTVPTGGAPKTSQTWVSSSVSFRRFRPQSATRTTPLTGPSLRGPADGYLAVGHRDEHLLLAIVPRGRGHVTGRQDDLVDPEVGTAEPLGHFPDRHVAGVERICRHVVGDDNADIIIHVRTLSGRWRVSSARSRRRRLQIRLHRDGRGFATVPGAFAGGLPRRNMEQEPATHTETALRLGRRPSGAIIEAAVHRYEGGAGPTVHVQAAQHGIELNGTVAARRLHERLTGAELAGTVVVVPVANPLAFDHRSYLTPGSYDARNGNLNRVWPGDDAGSLGKRVAARLWELVAEADAVVDLHTGSREMLEHVRFREGSESRALAEAFGTGYLLADPVDPDADGSGKLRAAAERAGVPALTAELSNSRTVGHGAVEAGVDGVSNVLRELDLFSGSPPDATATVLRDDLESVTADEAGLFEPRRTVGVGDAVGAGEELGGLYCPTSFECRSTVTAGADGVLYSLAAGRTVQEGERLAALATPS